VAVLHNNDLNQVTWELRGLGGSPQFLPSQRLPDFPYAQYARSLGLDAVLVEKPGDVGPAWDRALTADRPCLLEFVTDASVPPVPPHATWEQLEHAALSLLKGDTDALGVLTQGIRAKAAEILP
jgi:pyruvate dehydrogenase (quinone)